MVEISDRICRAACQSANVFSALISSRWRSPSRHKAMSDNHMIAVTPAMPPARGVPLANLCDVIDISIMDRRALLAFVASLSAVAASPAKACSVALRSPKAAGIESQQVRKLFEAWWGRNEVGFRALFTNILMHDGTLMDPVLASELLVNEPMATESLAIFDQFFTDENMLKRITLLVNTDAGVIVACSESGLRQEINADCSGMPKLHLFLVIMRGLNPRAITHLSSIETVEVANFNIWFEGSI